MTDYAIKEWSKSPAGYDAWTLDELETVCDTRDYQLIEDMKAGTAEWSNWRYLPATKELAWQGYAVDLEKITTVEEVYDWILHLNNKLWPTYRDLHGFVSALEDILSIRSWVVGVTYDATAIIESKLGA